MDADSYRLGIRDAFNELLRIGSLPLARWNLAQMLDRAPEPEDYASGYRHGREDALREAASVLRSYGLFRGVDAAEAVERVKK